MRPKSLLLVFAAIICGWQGFAQSSGEPFEGGAQALGMSNAALAMQGTWSLFQNQAGLVTVEGLSAGAFYQSRFAMRELSTTGFGAAHPLGNGVAGISYVQYGFSAYREQRVGLAYAQKLGQDFDAGVQIDYIGVFLGGGYGSTAAFTFQGGFRYAASSKVVIAGHAYNPIRARLSQFNDERLPAVIRLGGQYRVSDRVSLNGEARKHLEYPVSMAVGLEYELVDFVYVRGGIAGGPSRYSFGAGYRNGSFQFDIAASHNEFLGFTPQISLTWHGQE